MIVNISSILGRRGVPHNTEYCASKFAVHGFSESLVPSWPVIRSTSWWSAPARPGRSSLPA